MSTMSNRIDAVGATQLLADGVQFVDVLPASIFVQEHLPGALSLPLETLTSTSVEAFDRSKPVVVYCFDQH